MSRNSITINEIIFVLLIGIFGYISYMKNTILFLNQLNPFFGFVIYYLAYFILITIIAYLSDFVILGKKIKRPIQIIGTMLILFALNSTLGWENNYVNYVATGSFSHNTDIFYASEDGVLWYIVYDVFGVHSMNIAVTLAFTILPMLIALLGTYLMNKIEISF